MEQGAHESFADIVTGVIVLTGKILLANVVEDVIDTGNHLIVRQRQGVFRVQNSKPGHDFLICKDMAYFLFGFRIGNDGARVHLGTGAHHSQHTAHRQRFAIRFLKAQIIFFPRIFFTVHGNRNCLRIITDRTAACGQQKVSMMFPGNLNSFIQFGQCRIGHNAGDFGYILTIVLQNLNNCIINTVSFDGAAAINQHHVLSIFGQLCIQIVQRSSPK